MDRIFISQDEAAQAAKELVAEERTFDDTELTVVGIPFTNLTYGKTIPGYITEQIDLDDSTFLKLAKMAHEKNITLNDLMQDVLSLYIKNKNGIIE